MSTVYTISFSFGMDIAVLALDHQLVFKTLGADIKVGGNEHVLFPSSSRRKFQGHVSYASTGSLS